METADRETVATEVDRSNEGLNEEGDDDNDDDDGEDSDDDGFSSVIRPTLLRLLRGVLDQYPDDGQILKEVIQNALDAGASTVKVVHDRRPLPPDPESPSPSPHRLPLQGPALCVYNDARFRRPDWTAVRMIHDSFKKQDGLKVGRFGLGLKSLFHLTDHVCIISGERVLFLDPLQKEENRECFLGHLSSLSAQAKAACLRTMGGLFGFGEDCLSAGRFPGTLFWFPLRQTPSPLSSKVCPPTQVQRLLDNFRSEAPTLLLFLRQLCSLELYVRADQATGDTSDQPTLTFSVSLWGDSRQAVLGERARFSREVRRLGGGLPARPLVSVTSPRVRVTSLDGGGQSLGQGTRSWLVVDWHGGADGMTPDLSSLCRDEDLGSRPVMGAAFPLDTSGDLSGQIFCFLPLPPQSESPTGLPVHVNGAFALSQNRAHVKWPTADQHDTASWDRALRWNCSLVSEVLPPLYATLVRELASQYRDPDLVYSAVPDPDKVRAEWRPLLPELFRLLQDVKWVHTSGGNWVTPREAILVSSGNLNPETEEAVVNAYMQMGRHVVQASGHVAQALRMSGCREEATPRHLADEMRQRPLPEDFPPSHKLLLLSFLLTSPDPGILHQLPLLPTQDGRFQVFVPRDVGNDDDVITSATGPSRDVTGGCVLLSVETELWRLLPGLERRVVSCSLPPHLLCRLQPVALSGSYQLAMYEASQLPSLIPQVLEVSPTQSRNLDWLDAVWREIDSSFGGNLRLFEALPLLPNLHEDGSVTSAHALTENLVCRSVPGLASLERDLCSALGLLGVTVLPALPDVIARTRGVLGSYVQYPETALACLERAARENLTAACSTFNSEASQQEGDAVVRFLQPRLDSVHGDLRSLLRRLRLFRDTEDSPTCIEDNGKLAPDVRLPVPLPEVYVVTQDDQARLRLALRLGAVQTDADEVICKILEILQSQTAERYGQDERQVSMEFVVDSQLGKPDILAAARRVPFLRKAQSSRLWRADELFDPEDEGLQQLFLGEQRFPLDVRSEHLPGLRRLGLKGKALVTGRDLLTSATLVAGLHDSGQAADALTKAGSVVSFLTDKDGALLPRERCFYSTLSDDVRQELAAVPFLPVLRKPEAWPCAWKSEEVGTHPLARPDTLFSQDCSDLVGAIHLVLDEGLLKVGAAVQAARDCLRWLGVRGREAVSLELATEQLLTVAARRNLPREQTQRQHACCHSLYRHLDALCPQLGPEQQQFLLERLAGQPVLLQGSVLASPESLVMRLDTDCSPYLMQADGTYAAFMRAAGVRDTCDVDLLSRTLQRIRGETGDARVSDHVAECLVNVATLLGKLLQASRETMDADAVFLPDAEGFLRPASNLCLDDCDWLKESVASEHRFLDPRIAHPYARVLGVRTVRAMNVRESRRELPMPFGQHESLTVRLKGILSAYPRDVTVLKELLQNADDAGATEVKLIADFRSHPTERILDSSLAPLQGPALCVYNDSSFTDRDLQGLCDLGQGSKGDDPAKTGQFGVGFNAVYHLTDAPSFLTLGPGCPGRLCFLDPTCRFVPDVRPESPGAMYDIDRLRSSYPDQFGVYLEDQLNLTDKGTVFRLPLRTNELVSPDSLSHSEITPETVRNLLKEFEKEAFDLLLFLQSVRSLGIYHVSDDGSLVEDFKASLSLSEADLRQKQVFSDNLRREAMKTRERDMSITDVSSMEMTVTAKLEDSKGRQEEWLVVQRIGFSGDQPLHPTVNKAWRDKHLKLLPRGGVAVFLGATTIPPERFKAFCVLPLPLQTGLPLQVNGLFYVDENRRNMWKQTTDFRTHWNDSMASRVVVPCYVSAVQSLKTLWLGDSLDGSKVHAVQAALRRYHGVFPDLKKGEESFWKALGRSLYKEIAAKHLRLFPVLHREGSAGQPRCRLEFASVTSSEGRPGVFNVLRSFSADTRAAIFEWQRQKATEMETILKTIGMKVLEAPPLIQNAFLKAKVRIQATTPENVIEFLKSYDSDGEGCCRLGRLPRALADTELRSPDHVVALLDFCRKDKGFETKICGLPLLLTADGQLGVFGGSDAIHSNFSDLLPGSSSAFVHPSLRCSTDAYLRNPEVRLRPLDLDTFSALLGQTLTSKEWHTDGWNWDAKRRGPGGRDWLRSAWKFAQKEVEREVKEKRKELISSPKAASFLDLRLETRRTVQKVVEPLKSWSLVPAKTSDDQRVLYTVGSAWKVVTMSGTDTTVNDLVRRSRLPQLDWEARQPEVYVPWEIVSSSDNPCGLLSVLGEMSEFPDIKKREARTLLEYFARNLEVLKDEILEEELCHLLSKLPLYTTEGEQRTKLLNLQKTLCIEDLRLSTGLSEWAERYGFTMLQYEYTPTQLLQYLGVEIINATKFYASHLLPSFHMLPSSCRQPHLQRVRKLLPDDLEKCKPEETELVEALKRCSFIEDASGALHPAKSYLSPRVDVFKSLRPSELPPPPFCNWEWEKFMKTAGMVTAVSDDMFLKLARQLADSGRQGVTQEAKDHSMLLVRHLFDRENLENSGLLSSLRDIPFIVPYDMSLEKKERDFLALHEQFPCTSLVAFSNAVPHHLRELVWTSSLMVHPNCHPRKRSIERELNLQGASLLDKVGTHAQNISTRLANMSKADIRDKQNFLVRVLTPLYEFFQRQRWDLSLKLRDTLLVLLPAEGIVVPAREVILSMSDNEVIPGYLHRVDVRFGPYFPLFEKLGASPKVEARHYADVLATLRQNAADDELHVEDLRVAGEAISGLFRCLRANPKEAEGFSQGVLYFPDQDRRLQPSQSLVVVDNPRLAERAQSETLSYFLGFRELQIENFLNFEHDVRLLPASCRPRLLTQVVGEVVLTESLAGAREGPVSTQVSSLLGSQAFLTAAVRLLCHCRLEAGQTCDKSVVEEVRGSLARVSVREVRNLVTVLQKDGRTIRGSEDSSKRVHCRHDNGESGERTLQIFIKAVEPEAFCGGLMALQLARALSAHLPFGGVSAGTGVHQVLQMILSYLSSPETRISALLDEVGIRPYSLQTDAQVRAVLPPLGSFVPISEHSSLDGPHDDFHVRELVALCVFDPATGSALEATPASGTGDVQADPGDRPLGGLQASGRERESRSAGTSVDPLRSVREEGPGENEARDGPVYVYARITQRAESANDASVASPGRQPAQYVVDIGREHGLTVDASRLFRFRRRSRPQAGRGGGPRVARVAPTSRTGEAGVAAVWPEVRSSLTQARRRSAREGERKKKELLLRWRPENNPGREELCSQVTARIQSHWQALQRGGTPAEDQEDPAPFFSARPSHPESSSFSSELESDQLTHTFQGGQPSRGGHSSAAQGRPPNPQPGEARRWFRQAKVELDFALTSLPLCGSASSQAHCFAQLVCFHCHQAGELALRAAILNEDASNPILSLQELTSLASSLQQPELRDLAESLQQLLGSLPLLCRPDVTRYPSIPSELFRVDQAERACDVATRLVAIVERSLG